jgi:hypothetical protein
MAIKNLAQITCSLNLGLIYSLDYDYSPQAGATIRLFFVNQNGTYQRPQYMQKAQIRVGAASFSMYVVASEIQMSPGRRVMEVTFVDDTFRLDNYLIALIGKGCGHNIYQLGTPVDTRTAQQKRDAALDPDAEQIAELTRFPDIEYSFDDFLAVLRKHFTVQVSAFYDTSITNYYVGTFREVLDSWCALFNLSWYIENSVIKIFDPTRLTINLPSESSITDPISYNSLEDVRDTYGKTCANWFQQEGGEYSLNQTSDSDGALLVRTDTLFPIGYEFGLTQTTVDLNQAAAAQFGQPFWFLYNYWLGSTATNCGWTPITPSTSLSVVNSVYSAGGRIAAVNEPVFEQRYEVFKTYGESVAGRWYLSNQKSELAIDQSYQWFDESAGQIFSFTNVDDKAIGLEFLTPTTAGTNIIPGTAINTFYSGVNYVGNRIAYRDNAINSTSFVLTPAQQALVNSTYEAITIPGSQSMDFNSQLAPLYGGDNTYVGYNPLNLSSDLITLFQNVPDYAETLQPRFTSIPIKGIKPLDYSTLKSSQTEPDGVEIVTNNEGPTVLSNTAVIKTLRQGAYTVYYSKYEKCASAHTTGPYFGHRFELRQISSDNEIGVTFSKPSPNIYKLTRNYGVVDALVNNPLLPQMAQGRTFPTRRVSFTVNYFYDVPTNFLTNGLVGLSVSIGDNRVTATYSYSNEVLQVPDPSNQFARFEQMIRNSWIQRYAPNRVIS